MDFSRQQPLAGRHIVSTRPLAEENGFEAALAQWGARVSRVPMIAVQPVPFSMPPATDTFDWLFFTSRNAVRSFMANTSGALPRIAAIGEATAAELQAHGRQPDFVASVYEAGTAAREFSARHPVSGSRILWPCGNLARPTLREALEQAGVNVVPVTVYQTHPRQDFSAEERMLLSGSPDLVVFTSPSAVEAFHALGIPAPATASIGPVTADAVRTLLGQDSLQPDQYTLAHLAEAIRLHFEKGGI